MQKMVNKYRKGEGIYEAAKRDEQRNPAAYHSNRRDDRREYGYGGGGAGAYDKGESFKASTPEP
jgi:hypothetical protein